MTYNTGVKYTGEARRGQCCGVTSVGMGGHTLLEERTPYLPPSLLRCLKGASWHAGFSAVGREHVTLYHITKVPWPSRLQVGTTLIQGKPST